LKLWFAIRCDGVEVFQPMIRKHVALTQELAELVRDDGQFEIVAPHSLNLLCVALKKPTLDESNAATEDLITRANASGKALFTRTVLDGRTVLRISIGTRSTERHHVLAAWELLSSLV